MLVLGRDVGQELVIDHKGERLVVVVIESGRWNRHVRLGFSGPHSFVIHRVELLGEDWEPSYGGPRK